MKTIVKSVLVLPDDPNLTQPVMVEIRTDDGRLMRNRLEKLLRENKVVFVDKRLIKELQDDLNREVCITPDWQKELINIVCPDEVALLSEMQSVLNDEDREISSPEAAKLCAACRELWHRAITETEKLLVVRELKR